MGRRGPRPCGIEGRRRGPQPSVIPGAKAAPPRYHRHASASSCHPPRHHRPNEWPFRSLQLAEDQDTTYILRLPNSGGALIDGKPIADVIRSNASNPAEDGRYYPPAMSPEWRQGVASLCNDPRDAKRYNSRLTFHKRQGVNKALCELAPMRAILIATRDLREGEEIFLKCVVSESVGVRLTTNCPRSSVDRAKRLVARVMKQGRV